MRNGVGTLLLAKCAVCARRPFMAMAMPGISSAIHSRPQFTQTEFTTAPEQLINECANQVTIQVIINQAMSSRPVDQLIS